MIAADRVIPGFSKAESTQSPDVAFHLGCPAPWPHSSPHAHYAAPYVDDNDRPVVVIERMPEGYRFEYADGTKVWIGADAAEVWCTWSPHATFADTATYLTGPVLAFLLRLRGAFALHASAVRVRDGALLLVGPHGSGKSTAAAALGRCGCAVIADDIVRLTAADGAWMAQPFGGMLRLWPDGARLVLGLDAALPRITPTWDKRALEIGTHGVAGMPIALPVRAVAFLEPREHSPSAPRLDGLGGAEAVVRFATHSAAAHLLDNQQRAREFAVLGHLVRQVACTRAIASHSEASFPRFVDLLHDWADQRGVHAA